MSSEAWKKVSLALDSNNEGEILESFDSIIDSGNKTIPSTNSSELFNKLLETLVNPNLKPCAYYVIGILLEQWKDFNEDKIENLVETIATKETLEIRNLEDKSHQLLHNGLCVIIKELQDKYPQCLMPQFSKFGPYLVSCTQCESPLIATAAANYWRSLRTPPVPSKFNDSWIPPVLKQMAKLLPALTGNMTYHPDHVSYLESITQTSDDPEMPAEIEKVSNLRNYTAMGFENICRIFPSESIAIFVPLMDKQIRSEDWLQKEAIILAIGAFLEAVGKPKELEGVLPSLVQMLFQGYSHPKPLIRSITCFTMQQFVNTKLKKDPTSKMFKCTLHLLNDEYKEVQEMALRSLAALLAYSDKEIAPYAVQIIDSLVKADGKLKGRVRFPYYECISHLFGRMGVLLEEADAERLIKPMMDNWTSIQFDNNPTSADSVVYLCQPLCIVTAFSKHLFKPQTDIIFKKIAVCLKGVLDSREEFSNISTENRTKYIVSFFDLLSAMFEGQGKELKNYVENYTIATALIELLQQDKLSTTATGSGLALLGNICEYCPTTLQQHLDAMLDILHAKLNLKSENYEVINNALWALSNVTKSADTENEKMLDFCEKLGDFVRQPDLEESIMINAVLALTSLGQVWPAQVIQIVKQEQVFTHYCLLLQREFPRETERLSIFRGFCSILSNQTKSIDEHLWPHFIASVAIAECKNDETLKQNIRDLLQKVRSILGSNGWNRANQQLGSQIAYTIRKKYKMY